MQNTIVLERKYVLPLLRRKEQENKTGRRSENLILPVTFDLFCTFISEESLRIPLQSRFFIIFL